MALSARCDVLSAVPTCIDLKVYAGDGFAVRFHFATNGTPVPLDGTWAADIRRSPQDLTILTAFAVDTTDAANGIITAALSGAQTAALPRNVGLVWDLQNVPTDSQPRTWIRGEVAVMQDVTHG